MLETALCATALVLFAISAFALFVEVARYSLETFRTETGAARLVGAFYASVFVVSVVYCIADLLHRGIP